MKEFNEVFARLAYRNEFMRVFDDFLTLALCAFSMGRYEAQYFETIKRYNADEQKLFPHLLGALVAYYQRSAERGGWVDGLGEFFEEHNGKFGRSALGQFFTPPQICDLMAAVNGDANGDINDPAAGSGRCLIALDRLDPNNRLRNMYFAMDLDGRCVKMCTINFVLYGMKGFVVHMDSIKQDIFGGYRIYLPETGLGVVQLSAEQCRAITAPRATVAMNNDVPPPPIQEAKPQQLKLFEILAR